MARERCVAPARSHPRHQAARPICEVCGRAAATFPEPPPAIAHFGVRKGVSRFFLGRLVVFPNARWRSLPAQPMRRRRNRASRIQLSSVPGGIVDMWDMFPSFSTLFRCVHRIRAPNATLASKPRACYCGATVAHVQVIQGVQSVVWPTVLASPKYGVSQARGRPTGRADQRSKRHASHCNA